MGSYRSFTGKESAEEDLVKLQQELNEPFPPAVIERQHRERRGIPVAPLAVAAPGIFFLGMGFEDKLSCTLFRLSAGCNQIRKQNGKSSLHSNSDMNQ